MNSAVNIVWLKTLF
jgi:hypothetical protein